MTAGLTEAGPEHLTDHYASRRLLELLYSWWQIFGTAIGGAIAVLIGLRYGLHTGFIFMAVAGAVITGLAVTSGLHRLFSHRSFQARRPLELLLFILGTAAGQGYPIRWVYDHRIHHWRTDMPGDPHSPHWWGNRKLNPFAGFFHAHCLWLLRSREEFRGNIVRDLASDPTLVALDRAAPLIVLAGLLIPGFLGLLLQPGWLGFVQGVLWGGCVRMFLLNHVTWSVNSITHMVGRKPAGLTNAARNNLVVGLLALGEGWHGNHHLDPSSARHGWAWYQPDITWGVLRLFQAIGLIDQVRLPKAKTGVTAE